MHPNLMRPSRFELAFHQGYIAESLQHFVMGNGVFTLTSIGKHGKQLAIADITSNISGNGSRFFLKIAPNYGLILSIGAAFEKLPC